jgi:hypothetical protein
MSLWLTALIGVLPEKLRLPLGLQAFLKSRLDLLEGFVIYLVLRRAAAQRGDGPRLRNARAEMRAAGRHDVRARIATDMRATIGGHLRRALKGRSLKTRAAAILLALQNVDDLAARFSRRMKANLSRRAGHHTRALAGAAYVGAQCAACCASVAGCLLTATCAGGIADTS